MAVVAYAGRTPAVTGCPDGSSLPRPDRLSGWAREFVARQPVAAFRSPVVCATLTITPTALTLAAYLTLLPPTHPDCKRLHLTIGPSRAA